MTAPIRHAELADLPDQDRIVVRVTGEDATRFLQGLLTADVGELRPGRAAHAALLTVKGKIVSEIWILAASEGEPWLAIPAAIGDEVVARLDDHVIMDDVELETLDDRACAIAWRDDGGLHRAELELPAGILAFDVGHPLPGVLLVGEGPALAPALDALGEPSSAEAFTAARIAHARPAWGFEIVADRFPPEVGFVDAVSYDKGCYMGQEPLSRIHNRGKVNYVMVRVRLSGRPTGARPHPLTVTEGEGEGEVTVKPVGNLTSFATTADGSIQGLAIVRRAHAKPGAKLRAEQIEVEVRSGPLGDDPGGPARPTGTVTLGGRG